MVRICKVVDIPNMGIVDARGAALSVGDELTVSDALAYRLCRMGWEVVPPPPKRVVSATVQAKVKLPQGKTGAEG